MVGQKKKEFKAHKAILWARCQFFKNLFSSSMKETNSNIINLPEISSRIFSHVFDFMYMNSISFPDIETVIEIFKVAHYLLLDLLINSCMEFMNHNIDDTDIFIVLDIFLHYNLETEMLYTYINENFDKLIANHLILLSFSGFSYMLKTKFFSKHNAINFETGKKIIQLII